jgi:eukaryotic-like serine/threonine-protein kinase
MNCPSCGREMAPHLERCTVCGSTLTAVTGTGLTPDLSDTMATGYAPTGLPAQAPPSSPIPTPRPAVPPVDATSSKMETPVPGETRAGTLSGGTPTSSGRSSGPLSIGQSFGRYHVIRVLGVGGMGVVYQAWDEQLEVAVAIKVIRPQIEEDPSEAEVLEKRFKRELVLARQVTHRSVIRIHDMGEIDGIKYITMPYIQGSNLEAIIKKTGKLPASRALAIGKQIASGLQAAHEVGVVHRDFKPANILIDAEDHALITDFGIARSVSSATVGTVGVIGTVEYMAPEQARGQQVDQRADIYAFGLVLRDALIGHRAAPKSETGVAELMTRMQNAPPRARTIEPSIPEALDEIIDRCLHPDPAGRYQTTKELVITLEALDDNGHPRVPVATARTIVIPGLGKTKRTPMIAAAAVVILLGGTATWLVLRGRGSESSTSSGPVRTASLAILPFRNASGDGSLDWLGSSLAETLRNGIGLSSSLHVVSPDRVHQVLTDLRLASDAAFDPATLRRLADFTSADTIVWGQFVKFGDAVTITGTLEDLKTQRSVALKAEAANQGALISAVDQLAQSIRDGLAVSAETSKELQSTAIKPSTQSLQALRAYNEGLELARQGKQAEALKSFQSATEADPDFALAYSKLGQTYANLNYDNEAGRYSRRAVELGERLPAAERYQVLATHSRIINDSKKAIESYEQLLTISPNDPQVQFDLATLYENSGDVDRARDHFAKALDSDGKWIDALLAMGRVETKRRNVQGSLDYLNRALTLSVQLENDEAKSRILQAIGISYKRLNKPEDALRNYQESLAIKRRLSQKGGMAASLAEIGQVEARLGHSGNALKAYTEALQLRREIGDKRGVGNSLLDLGAFYSNSGKDDEALPYYRESLQIQRELGDVNYEALLLNNIGYVYLNKAQYDDAVTNFERALQLREKANVAADTALTLHNLADTSALLGQYDRAQQYYLRALELWRSSGDRRNAAAESYRIADVFGSQGRYAAAVKSTDEAVKALRDLRDRSPYLAEALSAYGSALAEIGLFDEAAKALDEALALGRELNHKAAVARTLNRQGELALYRGNAAQARGLFQQALPEANTTTDRALILVTRLNVASAGLDEGRGAAAGAELQRVFQEADRLGLQVLAAEASFYQGDALGRAKQAAQARQALERAVTTGERLGLRPLLAQAHHRLAAGLLAAGDKAGAASHETEARRLLDDIRKDSESDSVFARADFTSIRTVRNP